jgi:hypothetical protein
LLRFLFDRNLDLYARITRDRGESGRAEAAAAA